MTTKGNSRIGHRPSGAAIKLGSGNWRNSWQMLNDKTKGRAGVSSYDASKVIYADESASYM